MRKRKFDLHNGRKGAALAVRVTPNADENHVSGILSDGTIKISLADKTFDERLNHSLVIFLSEVLKISESKIEIVAGESGRDKLISILDLDAEAVQKLLLAGLD